jgi:AraC-like DNA-binding protein
LRAETRFLFGCEPRFAEGPPRIVFAAELARLPVVRRPDEVADYARTSLRRMLLAAPADTLHARLRALLSSTTPVASSSIDDAARHLGVSRATLARRLAREGTSFQALKDDVRRDHAIALLAGTSLPLGEIAERLGYSAQSAFQRAFRDWTGVSPGRMRAR